MSRALAERHPTIIVRPHPGCTWEEILNEPDWAASRPHRPGHKDPLGRYAGSTHINEDAEREQAQEKVRDLEARVRKGELLNFREVIDSQKEVEGFHLRNPSARPPGWRYVSRVSEGWVKNVQDWPANRRLRVQEQQKGEEVAREPKQPSEDGPKESSGDVETRGQAQVRRQEGPAETNQERPSKYSPQETAFLRVLAHEKDYIANLRPNDGKGHSPMQRKPPVTIDEADQSTPDNWVPRSADLIRLTGKLPLNAEPPLQKLYDAGLITPNELHYVRSHGAVPQLIWEFHQIEIQGGKVNISMEELRNTFNTINIPILMACDNTRRKELNMIKRTKGFNWGPGGVGCAYWRGPLLRDVLLAAGIPKRMPDQDSRRYWIHFEGADHPSEGKYATSIPFEYAMNPISDIILAYEMNDQPLPPDHGFPVRLMVPGYVGGRCVKWLQKIWVADKENDSHYHIWDNRLVPGFVTELDSEFARLLFHHPDTACYEQILNSVIVKPAQGEKMTISDAEKRKTYQIAGFAYGGAGHQINRVEVSLDDGVTWLYCIRTFPEAPIRHDNKFWTWTHWHVDVEISDLLRAGSITVRCFNSSKNTQPKQPHWNILGTLNNSWYVVKPELAYEEGDGKRSAPYLLFRHPTEPGTGEGGWMKPSTELQVSMARQNTDSPQRQFTREEIEKHNREDDCWIVVGGKVYDATSVLSWHPGGKPTILAHAGKVHQDTTDEYSSIHDDYANEQLQGVATDKAIKYIEINAKKTRESRAKIQGPTNRALQKHRWTPIKFVDRKTITHDTRCYTFQLPADKPNLGLETCQHMELAFHMEDQMLIRPYTPTRPLLPALDHPKTSDPHNAFRSGKGRFDLTIKTYFPGDSQPGGAMSNILDCLPLGEDVDMRGPMGDIIYEGNGRFRIYGEEHIFHRVSLVLGGSGITPGYALIARILLTQGDTTELRVIDANKKENDILLREELNEFEENSNGQMKLVHVLSDPDEGWTGLKGFVTEDIIRRHLFEPAEDSVVLLCGPPVMMDKAVLPALDNWKYVRDKNLFGF